MAWQWNIEIACQRAQLAVSILNGVLLKHGVKISAIISHYSSMASYILDAKSKI